jgi:signal transduction histidine kinase/CheY-like chemotaxis protein
MASEARLLTRLPHPGNILSSPMRENSDESPTLDPREAGAAAEQLLTELRYVTSHARCLLWHGTVTDWGHGAGSYHWQTQVFDEAAAQAFMPLEVRPYERYPDAWYRHRLPEGQRLTNQLSDAALQANEPSYSAEFGCRGQDGQVRWFAERVYVEPLPSPPPGAAGHWRVVGVAIDITDRKQTEEALQRAYQEKDEFLAMLAHELRNPLGAIRNAVHLLKGVADEGVSGVGGWGLGVGRWVSDKDEHEPIPYTLHPTPDTLLGRLQRATAVIERQVQLQTRIVSDLLDVSRLTRGRFQLQRQRIELRQLCRHTVDDFRPVAEAAGLTLSLHLPDEPVWVEGDPARLSQVLVNLLDNAVKFTEPGGEIGVRCSVFGPGSPNDLTNTEHRTPNTAVLTVTDSGCGIPPELLPHIFAVFTQAEQSLARSRGGLGLGLALVKGLVDLHGGEVSAASDGPGCGATFTLTLPILDSGFSALDSGNPDNPKSKIENPKSPHVLLIEDHRDAAETLRDLLEQWGYRVAIASHGRAGLEAARAEPPDLVLCDIGLPGMDGYAVARQLRQDPPTAALPLIAITGYGQAEDRQRAARAGFDHHLTKPIDPDELHRLLASLGG